MTQYHKAEEPYLCNKEKSFIDVISNIKFINGFPLTVINNDKSLYGVISTGDITRFLEGKRSLPLDMISAEDLANQNPIIGHVLDPYETIENYFTNKLVRSIPIINNKREVCKIVTNEKPFLTIGKNKVGSEFAPFILAEIGVNHNGDINEAFFLIKEAAKQKCNGVKFQYRSKNLYNQNDINSYDLGTQYIISEIQRTHLSLNKLLDCFNLAKELELEFVLTPFDEIALNEILDSKIIPSAIKIASCDLSNEPLIYECCKTGYPIILSTGMSFEREIAKTSNFMKRQMVGHAFLHCNSTYPAPAEDINLNYIRRLKEITKTVVGYSSHDGNIIIPAASILQGADIIEFHITRSKEEKGTDHRASIEVSELGKFIDNCNLLYLAKGNDNPRKPSQGEISNRYTLGKSYALKNDYKANQIIEEKDLILVSPGHGFSIDRKFELIGKKLRNSKKKRSLLIQSDIESEVNFNKNELKTVIKSLKELGYLTGIPVRYHDAKKLYQIFETEMLEFHMSHRDLTLDPHEYLDCDLQEVFLIVHAVEQFEDGFIFDLCSSDEKIIQRSLNEVDKLIRHIESMRNLFKQVDKIPIVLNPGGFTENAFLNETESIKKIEKCAKNLKILINKYDRYEFLPQTMPPYPWHQGGRSFHNLLTNKKLVKVFLDNIDVNLCFDVSHSFLSCQLFGEYLEDHARLFSDKYKHIHLSDAQGTNAEGLEIGEGCIDFSKIHFELKRQRKDYYLIPEIWQGHLNNGEKFARSIIRFFNQISSDRL